MGISVVICTHNPRRDYLERTLNSLRGQTLPKEQWELLLIDNASKEPLAAKWDLTWQPRGRHVREEELGLTSARLRGIREAMGEILVFVDDDNCLKADYLATAGKWFADHRLLGSLGAGRIIPEFEEEPAADLSPFMGMLALREVSRAHYSNALRNHEATPYGAGLCIRREFALDYAETCRTRKLARSLDRTGDALLSGGDIDMALHACKNGFLSGVIPELELLHLIPRGRTQGDYVVRMAEGQAASNYYLERLWNFPINTKENPVLGLLRYWNRRRRMAGRGKDVLAAQRRGLRTAREVWKSSGHA